MNPTIDTDKINCLIQNVQQKMGMVAKFVLENMNKPVTALVQAEFNILYDQYNQSLSKAEKEGGVSERDAISMRIECPVKVPDQLYEKFDSWFCDRLVSHLKSTNKFSIN